MATISECDRAIMRKKEQRSIRHTSDLMRSDMGVIPMLGLRNRNAHGKNSTTKSSVMVIICRPCPEEQAEAVTKQNIALTQHPGLM